MILYFTGTGNSLAIAKRIAQETGDKLEAMATAAETDLGKEKTVGLVYPCYDFNTPPAVREAVKKLTISPSAYVFIVLTCGAQAGNSIWTVRRILKARGVEVAYSHKIRVPDNSATIFGRDPWQQVWKFEKYEPRLQQIVDDIKACRHGHHFAWWGPMGWVMGRQGMERKMLGGFSPKVNTDRCVGCGLCAAVCPVGNIAVEGKATMAGGCTSCLACLHACPHQAMEVGGKPTPKEHQYRHPKVKLKELTEK